MLPEALFFTGPQAMSTAPQGPYINIRRLDIGICQWSFAPFGHLVQKLDNGNLYIWIYFNMTKCLTFYNRHLH